jgi:outer membrane protease
LSDNAKYVFIVLAVLCAVAIAQACLSYDLFIETGPEFRYTAGDSTYHISFEEPWAVGGHGESELEFPIANVMAGVKVIAGTTYGKNNRKSKGHLCIRLLKTIDKDAGTMKDSDWIENDAAFGKAPHQGKDLYTESDAELEGMLFDLIWAYHFSLGPNWALGPMLGFRYEELQYEIYGYKGYYWKESVSGQGKVLDYQVIYKIPFIGLSSETLLGSKDQLFLSLGLGYSDWVEARDRDDHLLRFKLSEAECEGAAYLLTLNLDWRFYPRWVLGVGAEYVDIDTRGKQHQGFYSGPSVGITYDVDDSIAASRWSTMMRVLYQF